jgi:chemotaxis protein methyltransferase CheR
VWRAVRAFMRARCGIVFDDQQSYLLEARLDPVARAHGFTGVDAFVWSATSPSALPEARAALIDAMTTHETRFFRDVGFWEVLVERLLPELSPHPDRGLQVWCAACSTGQEPYSLAMLLQEHRPDLFARTRILATDVAAPTVERARRGTFASYEANRGLDATRLRRHFDATECGMFRIRSHLRERVEWRVHNLVVDDPPGGSFDVVLLRNVLVYFDDASRARVLERVRSALRPGGLIGVGSTEQLAYERLAPGWFRPPRSGGG